MPQDNVVSGVVSNAAWTMDRMEAVSRLRLLADVDGLLSGAREWEQAVAAVAQRVVASFADWCAVDFLDEHGALRRLTVRHARPERALRPGGLDSFTPERVCPSAIIQVVRSGHSRLISGPAIPQWEGSRGGGSLLVVPLVARRRTLGALSLVRGPERVALELGDCSLAEELAARVGLAMEHARLMRESRAAEAESRRHAARLRVLRDMDRMLARQWLELPEMLDAIAYEVSELLGEEGGPESLREGDRLLLQGLAERVAHVVARARQPPGGPSSSHDGGMLPP